MGYFKIFIGSIVLVLILTFTIWALYQAISLPGNHKLDRLGESRKLKKTMIKKIVVISIGFVLVLNIIGLMFL